MAWRPDVFEQAAELAGFQYSENTGHQRFKRNELEAIAEELGVDHENLHCGRIKEQIAEKADFRFDQGYSTNPRDFNSSEVKSIIETLQEVNNQ